MVWTPPYRPAQQVPVAPPPEAPATDNGTIMPADPAFELPSHRQPGHAPPAPQAEPPHGYPVEDPDAVGAAAEFPAAQAPGPDVLRGPAEAGAPIGAVPGHSSVRSVTGDDHGSPLDHVHVRPPLQLGPDGRCTIEELLLYVTRVNASDLHVKAGSPPTIRVSGQLEALDYHVLDDTEAHQMATALMGNKEAATLEEKGEADFAYSMSGSGRFRVNVHRQRGSLGIAARRIVPGVPSLQQLGVPPTVEQLANEHRGLLLVTGPTSSGKTTTCGSIIRHINETRRCHIVTIEDPIEILHKDDKSVVTQREIGQDTADFHAALRAAMRQDPDVIFVGEIRDTETVQAALQAAETGHFVLATLHTTNVAETINRIIDFFPPDQQNQVRVSLGGSLVGVMTQRLLPKAGGGRALAVEIMVSNGRIRDCILDPQKTHEIHDIVAQSGYYGMQTFDQALVKLYGDGEVTLEDARAAANSPHDFELALQQAGLLSV